MENNSKQSPCMMMPQRAETFGPLFHPQAVLQQRTHVFPPEPIFHAAYRENAIQQVARSIPIQMHSPTAQVGHQTTPMSVDCLSAAPLWMLANTSEFTILEEEDDDDDSDDMPELIDGSGMVHKEETRSVGAHLHSSEEGEARVVEQNPIHIQVDVNFPSNIATSRETHCAYPSPAESKHSSLTSPESSSDNSEDDSQDSISLDEGWSVPLTISLEMEHQNRETSPEGEGEDNSSNERRSEFSSEKKEDEDPGYLADLDTDSPETDSSDEWESEDDYDSDSDASDDDDSPDLDQAEGNHDSGYESARTQEESEGNTATEVEDMQNSVPHKNFAQRFIDLDPAELAVLKGIDASWEDMQRLLQQEQQQSTKPSTQEQQRGTSSTAKEEMACFNAMMAKNEESEKRQSLPLEGVFKLSELTTHNSNALDRIDAFYTNSNFATKSERRPRDQDCAIWETGDDLSGDEYIRPCKKPAYHSTRAPIPCAPRRKEVSAVSELLASGQEREAELFANALRDEVGGRNKFGYLSKQTISVEECRRINDEFIKFAEGSATF